MKHVELFKRFFAEKQSMRIWLKTMRHLPANLTKYLTSVKALIAS